MHRQQGAIGPDPPRCRHARRAVADREGVIRYAQELAFSADGRLLAIAGPAEGARRFNMMGPKASTIRLLDVAGGAEVRRIAVEGFGVGSLAFSPDGRTLAAGVGDRTIRLYDPATGQERLPRLGRERAVPPSPEGKGELKGYGATKGFDEAKAREPSCLAFSPDGSLLASGLEDLGYYGGLVDVPPITLWDVAAAREVHRFAGHPRGITSLAFSPDGKTLASSGGEAGGPALGRRDRPRGGSPAGTSRAPSTRWRLASRRDRLHRGPGRRTRPPLGPGRRPLAGGRRREAAAWSTAWPSRRMAGPCSSPIPGRAGALGRGRAEGAECARSTTKRPAASRFVRTVRGSPRTAGRSVGQ